MSKLVELTEVQNIVKSYFNDFEATPDRDYLENDLLDRLGKAKEQCGWVVLDNSDQLPEAGELVLTYGQNGGLNMAFLISDNKGEVVWRKVGKNKPYQPKAWMRVPTITL